MRLPTACTSCRRSRPGTSANPFTRNTSCARIAVGKPGAERRRIDHRAGIDDKTLEIVVVVLAFELVQRRPRREIVLGARREAKRYRRGTLALLGRDQL